MKKLIIICAMTSLLFGCEVSPNKVVKIKTEDGKTIRLLCPVIKEHKEKITYWRGDECVMLADEE